jgi:hypothetical protein
MKNNKQRRLNAWQTLVLVVLFGGFAVALLIVKRIIHQRAARLKAQAKEKRRGVRSQRTGMRSHSRIHVDPL